jgi:hypothetical protein
MPTAIAGRKVKCCIEEAHGLTTLKLSSPFSPNQSIKALWNKLSNSFWLSTDKRRSSSGSRNAGCGARTTNVRIIPFNPFDEKACPA